MPDSSTGPPLLPSVCRLRAGRIALPAVAALRVVSGRQLRPLSALYTTRNSPVSRSAPPTCSVRKSVTTRVWGRRGTQEAAAQDAAVPALAVGSEA